MANDGTKALAEFLETDEGERFLREAKTRSAVKAEAIEKRRALAAERENLLRRRRDVIPGLRRREEEADQLHTRAREVERAAQRKVSEARTATFNEDWSIKEALHRAEIALRRTADPRILAAIEEAVEARHRWPETAGALYRWKSVKATTWDGTDSWVKQWGNNQAGIDALKKAIVDAEKAMELLALVPEPSEEDIAAGIARVKAAIAATQGDPPPMVMTEYDSNGRPKAR